MGDNFFPAKYNVVPNLFPLEVVKMSVTKKTQPFEMAYMRKFFSRPAH